MRRLLIPMFALLPLAAPAALSVGQLYKAGGSIDINRDGQMVVADTGSPIQGGDALDIGSGEAAALRMADDEVVSLGASTRFQVLDYQFNPRNSADNRARYRLDAGSARLISGLIATQKLGGTVLEGEFGEVSSQGGDYTAFVAGAGCSAPGMFVQVNAGQAAVQSAGVTQTAKAGQVVVIPSAGSPPSLVSSLPACLIPAPDPTGLLLAAGLPGGSTLRIEFTASVCDEAASPTLPECTASR